MVAQTLASKYSSWRMIGDCRTNECHKRFTFELVAWVCRQLRLSSLVCTVQLFFCLFVYFILSRLLNLAFSANLGLLCMPHPGMGPLV